MAPADLSVPLDPAEGLPAPDLLESLDPRFVHRSCDICCHSWVLLFILYCMSNISMDAAVYNNIGHTILYAQYIKYIGADV